MGDDKLLNEIFKKLQDPSFQEEWSDSDAIDDGSLPEYDTSEFDTPEYEAKFDAMFQAAYEKVEQEKADQKKADALQRKKYMRKRIFGSVAAAILIFAAFISFTEPGQALGRIIVKFLGLEMHIQVIDIPQGSYPTNTDFDSVSFSTLKEASEFLGYPIIGIDDDKNVSLSSVEITNIGFGVEITANYITNENKSIITKTIVTEQLQDASYLSDISGGKPKTHDLSNGEMLYRNINSEGHAYGLSVWDNVYFEITSDGLDWNALIDYVDKLSTIK